MSETERKKRLEHRRKRKNVIFTQTIIAAVIAVMILFSAVSFFKAGNEYSINYAENSTVDYKVYLKDNDFYEEDYLGKDQAYIASLIDRVVANFDYTYQLDSTQVSYNATYTIGAQVVLTVTQTGKVLLEKNYPIKENVAVTSTGSKLYIKESAVVDYDTYNDFANSLVKTYNLSGVSSSLRLFLNVNVNGVCADFESKKLSERTTTMMIPLTQELVDININASLPYHESSVIVCGKNDKNIFKVLAISLSIIELVLIIELIVYIYATRNDDINYEIKVKRLVNAYKSYIQKILTEFNCDGYQVLKVDTFNEMLDIRDTVNLPILMSENSDKTCTTFVIPTNNNILYLHEIKVDDYDEIYASTSTSEDELAFTETVDDIFVSETVEDISVDETLTEAENETSSFRGGLKYNYSFLAKLHLSSEDTREFYKEIISFINSYGLKVNSSWNKERIQVGKKTYAILSFKGLKLTVSFALNPADYEGTKYKLIDVSAVKKFAKVPAQMKITSYRKVAWVKELFNVMLKADGVENKEIPVEIAKVRPKTKRKLIKENLIKVEK